MLSWKQHNLTVVTVYNKIKKILQENSSTIFHIVVAKNVICRAAHKCLTTVTSFYNRNPDWCSVSIYIFSIS